MKPALPGVPTYNDAREAYGLQRATSFANVSSDESVQKFIHDAYGGDIGLLDALVGALAESYEIYGSVFFGDLLQVRRRVFS